MRGEPGVGKKAAVTAWEQRTGRKFKPKEQGGVVAAMPEPFQEIRDEKVRFAIGDEVTLTDIGLGLLSDENGRLPFQAAKGVITEVDSKLLPKKARFGKVEVNVGEGYVEKSS